MENSIIRHSSKRKDIPDGIWAKCLECGEIIYIGELTRNLRICPKCDYYFPLEPAESIALLTDARSLVRYDDGDAAANLDEEVRNWAVITGEARLSGHRLVIVALNLNFSNEDISLFVCRKIVKAVNQSVKKRLPLLLTCTNGVGLLPQDDLFLPARTLSINAALGRLNRVGLLYISVLACLDSNVHFPGFVYAADIVIAESNMPEASRTSKKADQNAAAQMVQSLFQSGMIDLVVSRRISKQTLSDILKVLS